MLPIAHRLTRPAIRTHSHAALAAVARATAHRPPRHTAAIRHHLPRLRLLVRGENGQRIALIGACGVLGLGQVGLQALAELAARGPAGPRPAAGGTGPCATAVVADAKERTARMRRIDRMEKPLELLDVRLL
jgi:hypothetical protein